MTVISTADRSSFETTKRLLAQIVNEGLATARITAIDSSNSNNKQITLQGNQQGYTSERWVKVDVRPDSIISTRYGQVTPILRPESLQLPVILGDKTFVKEELDPGTIFRFMSKWFTDVADGALIEKIANDLQETVENQKIWIAMNESRPFLTLDSPLIAWEQSLTFGHPTHPFHRLLCANPPLSPVEPNSIPQLLIPSLAFVSVPRVDMRITGPFEETLAPLLGQVSIFKDRADDRIIVPCLSQQLPAIFHFFANAILIKEVPGIAYAQASMRSITLHPELEFNYHMKMSLACQITSAVRTITPWTTGQGLGITRLLDKVLPADLWVFREVAAICGNQEDFNAAKNLSCVFREDLEKKARQENETLIIAAALFEQHPRDGLTYAERLFKLESADERKAWSRRYLRYLFELFLHPLVHHGIALEAHMQNTVVRICKETGAIKGFAIRDFGGVKFHKPTLLNQGFDLSWEIPGSLTLTDDSTSVLNIAGHTLLQSHAAGVITAMCLEENGGWALVREGLSEVLTRESSQAARDILGYFLKDTVVLKCFLRMIMEGVYRHNLETNVPNPLWYAGKL